MKKKSSAMLAVLKYAAMSLLAVTILYPFLWLLFTSFKPEQQIITFPPTFLPGSVTLYSYESIWSRIPFLRYYFNSVVFAGFVTLSSLILDSMAGYAFARLQFKHKNAFFWLILCTMMIPFQVVMIPLYIEEFHLGLIDKHLGLILPRACDAFGIFMMRQFFVGLPVDLEEAGRIDGCSEFRIFRSIMLPLCKPVFATLGIFIFLGNWNDLLYPMILTTSEGMKTLQAGIAQFMGKFTVEFGVLMAGACLVIAPILVAYMIAQKYFIEGIAMSGLKG
jgi:multiple sugar transport system permease protein